MAVPAVPAANPSANYAAPSDLTTLRPFFHHYLLITFTFEESGIEFSSTSKTPHKEFYNVKRPNCHLKMTMISHASLIDIER